MGVIKAGPDPLEDLEGFLQPFAALRRYTKLIWEEDPNVWLWHPSAIWTMRPEVNWPAAGLYFGADFYDATPT